MPVKYFISSSVTAIKRTFFLSTALIPISLYAAQNSVNAETLKPNKTFPVRGKTIDLTIRVQNEGLALLVKPAAGVRPFTHCKLTLDIDGRPQALQPAGRCAFISMPLPAAGNRLIDAFADGDAASEHLSGMITIEPIPTRSPSKKQNSQWGTFAALLLFVIATLLGGLLALKRKT